MFNLMLSWEIIWLKKKNNFQFLFIKKINILALDRELVYV